MSEKIETTLLVIKPDGVRRGLIGEIIKRVEAKGLKIVALKMMKLDRETAEKLYEMHKGKGFYEGLIEYMTSAPIVAMMLQAPNATKIVRTLIGATDPTEASPGTIRGDFAISINRNVVHAADSRENAEREIRILFKEPPLNYQRVDESQLY